MERKNFHYSNNVNNYNNIINRPKHYSISKEKTKNEIALFKITNELNRIKNITKVNMGTHSYSLTKSYNKNSSQKNIFSNNKSISPKKNNNNILNMINKNNNYYYLLI